MHINVTWNCWAEVVWELLFSVCCVYACQALPLYNILSNKDRYISLPLVLNAIIGLTLWEPPGFGDFFQKNSSFRLPYQRPSSSAHCARELFSGWNGSASLVDCTQKKFFAWGLRFFLSDVISGRLFGHLGPLCLALGANR